METKFNFNRLVNLIIGIVILLLLVMLVWVLVPPKSKIVRGTSVTNIFIENTLKSIDPSVSESLPYSHYVKVRDSIVQMRKLKNAEITAVGFESGFPFIGTYTALYFNFEKPFSGWEELYEHGEKQYFIKLPGWRLRPSKHSFSDSLNYYADNGHAFIRKVVWDSAVKTSDGKVRHNGHYADIPVRFKYLRSGNGILIPVSLQIKSILNVLFMILGLAGIVYVFYFIVGGFIKFLIDVSKGQSFTRQNISRLRLIAISLIAYPVIVFIMNILMWVVFSTYLTEDVVLHNRIWQEQWKIALVGIGLFHSLQGIQAGS